MSVQEAVEWLELIRDEYIHGENKILNRKKVSALNVAIVIIEMYIIRFKHTVARNKSIERMETRASDELKRGTRSSKEYFDRILEAIDRIRPLCGRELPEIDE